MVGREETKKLTFTGANFLPLTSRSPVCVFEGVFETAVTVLDDLTMECLTPDLPKSIHLVGNKLEISVKDERGLVWRPQREHKHLMLRQWPVLRTLGGEAVSYLVDYQSAQTSISLELEGWDPV